MSATPQTTADKLAEKLATLVIQDCADIIPTSPSKNSIHALRFRIEKVKRNILTELSLASLLADRERVKELESALCFFASVIKSGERWSDVCEAVFNKAITTPMKGGK
jgi:hypothetical protein